MKKEEYKDIQAAYRLLCNHNLFSKPEQKRMQRRINSLRWEVALTSTETNTGRLPPPPPKPPPK